jgi:Dehydrogenases with different specificities (related to short-chain alcohol dehydrogenases)
MGALTGKIAVVAGATRGAGRGIATELGAAGATVYCTGRSVRGNPSPIGRPETIEETAEIVSAHGGIGIPVRCDHTESEQVAALFARVAAEQDGRLDILVNDVWGGETLTEWKPFWEQDLEKGLFLLRQAIHSHIITARHALPMMMARGTGLHIEVTDGDGYHYRGAFFYDLVKVSVIRIAENLAHDLKTHGHDGITAFALTPGYLRSEEMLAFKGVTEANWRDAAKDDPHFGESETPRYIGRAVVALATDPNVHEKAGKALATWHLHKEYGFTDVDDREPYWPNALAAYGDTPLPS